MLNPPVEVAPDVFVGRGTHVNWVVLRDGTELTLIDGGYPGDVAAVEASIRALGRAPEDVRALLITHAHVDHIGAANHLHERYGIPAYTGTQEVGHAHRDYLEQAGPGDVIRNAWRPRVLRWALRISRKGGASRSPVPHAQPFPTDGALDLPGHPVPVLTRGHTSGHTVYHLPAVGAVVTGDALVTGHATVRERGPQVLPAMFNHGNPLDALPLLADLDADLILPGHGDPHRQPLRAAADEARTRARA